MRARHGFFQTLLEITAQAIGLEMRENVAVLVVIDAVELEFGFGGERASRCQDAGGFDHHHVFIGRINGGWFADLRPRDGRRGSCDCSRSAGAVRGCFRLLGPLKCIYPAPIAPRQ